VKSAMMLASLLSVVLPAAAEAAKPAPHAVAQNWLKVSARTRDGAIVVGNPAAKVKIVEYLSLTCPHCALMAGQSMAPLKRDYIAKGIASFEVRHAVRHGYDFVGSLLVRCQPATDYLDAMELLFSTQESWIAKAMAAKDDAAFEAENPDQKMVSVAHSAGFDALFAKRGMTPQRFSACMANKAAKQQLGEMADKAWNADKIPGTPAFRINGTMQGSLASWAELEKAIKAAL